QARVKLSDTGASFKEQLPSLLGPDGNKNIVRQLVRWEGEGGTASASGDLSSSVGASAPVVEAPVVPVVTLEGGQLEAPHVSIRSRFGVEPDKYLDHGSI